jgi:excisionase family DNA binding protein
MPLDITDLSESLTVNEFAALLHLHRATVERLLKNGEVDYVRIGHGRGRIRIPRRAAVDYINRMHRKRDTA